MKTKLTLMIVLCVGVMLSNAFAAGQVQVRYEPHSVTFTGMLEVVVFPGPPNFMDIDAGDEPEHCLILNLDNPIDVQGDLVPTGEDPEGWPNTGSYTNITKVHVVRPPDTPEGYWSRKLPARVRVHGTLIEAITGHHRTEVVLFSIEIMALEEGGNE